MQTITFYVKKKDQPIFKLWKKMVKSGALKGSIGQRLKYLAHKDIADNHHAVKKQNLEKEFAEAVNKMKEGEL